MSLILYGIIIVLAIIVLGILYYFMRDSASNNFRRARKHHRLGHSYFHQGKGDRAQKHYDLSAEYREKAEKQMKEV